MIIIVAISALASLIAMGLSQDINFTVKMGVLLLANLLILIDIKDNDS